MCQAHPKNFVSIYYIILAMTNMRLREGKGLLKVTQQARSRAKTASNSVSRALDLNLRDADSHTIEFV